ncbi:MAG: diacylglycerol kinase (ATP) [Gammaproteobacteria bacterium]|jgi:diacylglycerol kinase (ATP)
MTKQGTTGVKRIANAYKFSWQGLKAAYRNEAAFRQEFMLAVILAPLGLWLGNNGPQKALLLSVLVLVLIVELLNSAVETVVDRFGGENHELSGRAKDIGSAAVFVALINVIVVWTLVLFG